MALHRIGNILLHKRKTQDYACVHESWWNFSIIFVYMYTVSLFVIMSSTQYVFLLCFVYDFILRSQFSLINEIIKIGKDDALLCDLKLMIAVFFS